MTPPIFRNPPVLVGALALGGLLGASIAHGLLSPAVGVTLGALVGVLVGWWIHRGRR
jgi:hypothetical protein